jgi:hypothetical protein
MLNLRLDRLTVRHRMPVLFLLLAGLLFACGPAATAFGQAPAQQSTASLQETLDWIRDTLAVYGRVAGDTTCSGCQIPNEPQSTLNTSVLAGYQGCTVTLVNTDHNATTQSSDKNWTTTQTATVPLDQLAPGVPTVTQASVGQLTYYLLGLVAKSNGRFTPVISIHTDSFGGGPNLVPADQTTFGFSLNFSDAQMAQRVANAFGHAIDLCRAQKSPF